MRRLLGVLLLAALALPGIAHGQDDAVRESHRSAQIAFLSVALAAVDTVEFASSAFFRPVDGRLSSPFGWRNVSVNGNRFHGGVDWAAPSGTPVTAARSGVVVRAGWWSTYGLAVALDHGDGSETRYAHLSELSVSVGDVVRQGDVIGAVGSTGASTGPHLHFELRFDSAAVDPLPYVVDPPPTATARVDRSTRP